MEDRGDRRSEWRVLRRCIMLVARLLKSSASNTELLAIVSIDENVPKDVLQKRFENDRQRLRELDCIIEYNRNEDLYELRHAGVFQELLDAKKYTIESGAISPETFIRVWQSAPDIRQIAEKLGITPNAANARAHYYRQQGVKLKNFRRGIKKSSDWTALAKLAESLLEDKPDGHS